MIVLVFFLWLLLGAVVLVVASRRYGAAFDAANLRRKIKPAFPLAVMIFALLASWQLQEVPRVLRTSADLTSQHRNSLSDLTRRVFTSLNEQSVKVQLVTFIPGGSPEYRPLTILLNKYGSLGAEVRIVDPNQQPTVARELGADTVGATFAISGSRRVRVEAASELGITTAVVQAAAGQMTLCWTQGHGELNPDDPILELNQQALERNGITVRTVRLASKPDALAGCDVVTVVAPRGGPVGAESAVWEQLTVRTGRALLVLDPDTTPADAAAAWLAPLKLTVSKEPVSDPDGSLINDPRALVVSDFPTTSLVTKDLASLVLINAAGISPEQVKAAGDATALAVTGSNGKAGQIRKPAVAVQVDKSEVTGSGAAAQVIRARSLVITDADWLNNEAFTLSGNEKFYLNALRWLHQPDPVVAVGSPAVTDLLVLTPKDLRRIDALMFGVPSLLVATGLAMTLLARRRRGSEKSVTANG